MLDYLVSTPEVMLHQIRNGRMYMNDELGQGKL
jgi:hypothetical protein